MLRSSVLAFVPRLSLYRHMLEVLRAPESRSETRRVDVATLREEAARQRRRGDHAGALRSYLTLATREAGNPMHCVRAGDCQLLLGRSIDAAELYREAAARFRQCGHTRRARALLRRVLQVRPGDAAARAALAEMATDSAAPSIRAAV